jgi:AAA family ATP:ADP antiporter
VLVAIGTSSLVTRHFAIATKHFAMANLALVVAWLGVVVAIAREHRRRAGDPPAESAPR